MMRPLYLDIAATASSAKRFVRFEREETRQPGAAG